MPTTAVTLISRATVLPPFASDSISLAGFLRISGLSRLNGMSSRMALIDAPEGDKPVSRSHTIVKRGATTRIRLIQSCVSGGSMPFSSSTATSSRCDSKLTVRNRLP